MRITIRIISTVFVLFLTKHWNRKKKKGLVWCLWEFSIEIKQNISNSLSLFRKIILILKICVQALFCQFSMLARFWKKITSNFTLSNFNHKVQQFIIYNLSYYILSYKFKIIFVNTKYWKINETIYLCNIKKKSFLVRSLPPSNI